jgi:ribosomal protein S18 acetylase RimI-like enzyme
MQTAEEQMKQEGAGVMSLEVAENNAAAQQFYRSFIAAWALSASGEERIAKYYGGRVDAEVMEKVILKRFNDGLQRAHRQQLSFNL